MPGQNHQSEMQPQLAVANLNRETLPGPQLLDCLLSSTSSEDNSIEYADAQGSVSSISYGSLHDLSSKLAVRIKMWLDAAPRRNAIIPVILPQHPALYVSYQAVLKCGAAFCPVAPDTPEERLRFIIQDVEATFILCQPRLVSRLQNCLQSITCLPVDLDQLSQEKFSEDFDNDPLRRSSDTAYVMYTSGSTGKPKGVPVSHLAVTQSLLAHDTHIPPFKRFLQFAAPTFDVSLFEIFFPWFRGATIVCCDKETMLLDLPKLINTMSVDAVELTPTIVTTFLRRRSATPGLKTLLTIGEMLTPQVVTEFGGSEQQESMLFAMYGPTEAAIHCTIVPRMAASSSVQYIGFPLSTVTAFVLDETGEQCHPRILLCGETGELAIAGQLADGYLKRHEQTTAAFISMPGYGPLYRTGDRARMTTKGSIQILGRISSGQIKIRGQRVELGEVEAVASQVSGVQLALAMVIQDKLVLFCHGSSSLRTVDIEHKCKAWLPRHMIPGDIVISMHELPRLPSGKADRKALEAVYKTTRTESRMMANSPLPGRDNYLINTISTELNTQVDPHVSLWTYGLDSLRAIRIASELRSRYPTISVSAILEADSVTDLDGILESSSIAVEADSTANSSVISGARWKAIVDGVLNHNQDPKQQHRFGDVLPCDPMQTAMLSESMRSSELNFNEITFAVDASIPLARVVDVFKNIAHQNAILRAKFVVTGDPEMPFVQLIQSAPAFDEVASMQHPLQLSPDTSRHIIRVKIHHALYDGWSWDILTREINSVLKGGQVQERPAFHDLVHQRQTRFSTQGDEDLAVWTTHLRDIRCSEFPTLCTEIVRSSSRAKHSSVLSASHDELSQAVQHLHISKATFVHTALSLLLAALMDTSEVVTGLVIAGREPLLAAAEQVIGPCLLTLPSLVRFDACSTAREAMQRVYREHMRCLCHSSVSLAQIQSALHLTPGSLLFDVLFVWQESLYSSPQDSDLVTIRESRDCLSYALVVEVEPFANSFRLTTTFDTARLSEAQVAIFHDQINFLTQTLLKHHDTPLETLWQNGPNHLLSVSNPNPEQPALDALTGTITRLAHTDPDRIAVDFVTEFDTSSRLCTRQILTYRQLHVRASNAARLLKERELVRDDIVVIWSSKSIDLYVMICATLMAGVAYLCVDPSSPESRIREIILQAKPPLLVTDLSNDGDYGSIFNVAVLPIRDFVSNETDCHNPVAENASGADLAYAVFTSGSTGVPKGVLVSRDNLMSNIQHLASHYPHDVSSRLLQSCSPAFDVSVFEIFWTWHCGMTLCSAGNDVLFRDIEALIRALRVTHLSMTPSVAALVQPKNVPNVQFLVCAGEPMSAKVFETWAEHGLHQGYGPSETTNVCNVRTYDKGRAHINNVGKPFANTSLFICSRRSNRRKPLSLAAPDFQLLPLGGVGEVWIGGTQVGRGYTDSESTSASWMHHHNYGRLYRSGDIGRVLADGSLVILGREDDQTKIRGQRVELNEVNAKLMQSHLVSDAFTFVLKLDTGRDKLISFWVRTNPASVENNKNITEVLYEHLRDSLPVYMIPEALIPLSSLPLTPQGKADKRALTTVHDSMTHHEQAEYSDVSSSDARREHLSEEETQITKVLAEVAHVSVSDIDNRASFFTYGIDSIRAISFAQKLRSVGMNSVEVSSIMKHSSVRRLSAYCMKRRNSLEPQIHKAAAAAAMIPAALRATAISQCKHSESDIRQVLPCTALQEAMLSSQLGAESAYINHVSYRLKKEEAIVKRAWMTMVDRHDLLRTLFAMTDDPHQPFVQLVLTAFKLPWTTVSDSRFGKVPSAFEHPPYNLQLRRSTDDDIELHLFMHHALYDADSLNSLHAEIETLCRGDELLEPVPFVQYLNFMASIDTEKAERFWQSILQVVRPCVLSNTIGSNRSNRSNHKKCETVSRRIHLPSGSLASYAKQQSTSTLAVLQASLARLLSASLQTRDVCFGTVYSGRNIDIPDIDRTIGPCFNTLPVRLVLRHSTTNADLFQQVQKLNSAILPFQPTPLRRLQRRYSPDGGALFDVLLLLQSSTPEMDHDIWDLVNEEGQMDFPFIFEVQPDGPDGTIIIKLHTTVQTEEGFIDILLDHFCTLLRDTTEKPEGLALTIENELSITLPEGRLTSEANITTTNKGATHKTDLMSEQSTTGQAVCSVLATLTNKDVHNLSLNYSMFQLGLDSINAVQLTSKLRSSGYPVTVGEVLESQSVGAIITLCDRKRNGIPDEQQAGYDLTEFDLQHREDVVRRLQLDEDKIEAIWPCTATQTGILSEFLRSEGQLYFNTMRLHLIREVDLQRLQKACSEAMDRHAMLRTGFAEITNYKTPFAMIIYKAGTSNLPWSPDEPQILDDSGVQNISRPPWYIKIGKLDDSYFIELKILHALYDGQSLQIILRDVAAAYYHQPLAGCTLLQQPLSSILASNSSIKLSEEFWQSMRARAQPTAFPDLNIMRAVPSKLREIDLVLRESLSIIQGQCEIQNCSLLTACQAAWARVLAAYTGQEHVVFGNILSGRSFAHETFDRVAFPCINTLPVIATPLVETSNLLRDLSHLNAEFHKNPHVPLSRVKMILGAEGDLFDTVLVLQKYSNSEEYDAPWTVESETASAAYAVSLEIIPSGDKTSLRLTYDQKLVPQEHSLLLLEQYESTLYEILNIGSRNRASISTTLASLLPQIPLMTTAAHCLHDLVLDSAARNAETTALEYVTEVRGTVLTKRTWNFQELIKEASRIANLLLEYHVQPGDFVAICSEKCPEASFALLAILISGCAYVAIDPNAPVSRRDFILKDANCKLLLTTTLTGTLNDIEGVTILCIDDRDLLEHQSTALPQLRKAVTGDDICYCLYTSGTTGTPKGCLITHRSVVQAMLSFSKIFEGHWTAESKWLQFAAYHFDVSVLEHFWSWKEAMTVTIAPRDLLFEDLPGTISKLGITHLDLTPSLARLLTPELVPSLSQGVFIVGGEQVRQDIIDLWADAGCLYNFYGPSEVTIGCTVHPRVRRNVKPTNIGQPWANVGAYVLQPETQKAVLIGAIGELCLSGVLVGRGYLNRPELTMEKFVTLQATGERIYRTGDLVRMLYDHSFEFLGRIDDQIKLRGQRLEIGEIDHVIHQNLKDFVDVATLFMKHPDQEKEQLVAFLAQAKSSQHKNTQPALVLDEQITVMAAQVRNRVADCLPGYMLPTYFLVVNSLPLTVNNKADAKALRTLYQNSSIHEIRRQQETRAVHHHVPTEKYEELVSILARYTGIDSEQINSTMSLFQLGIDSISVISLSQTLRSAGFRNASVATLMKRPAVMDLAVTVCGDTTSKNSIRSSEEEEAQKRIRKFALKHQTMIEQNLKIPASAIQDILPCTPLQEGMISKLAASESQRPPYLAKFTYRLGGNDDIADLRQAWVVLERQLSILRTRFVPTDDGYAQVILTKLMQPLKTDCGSPLLEDDLLMTIDQRFQQWCQDVRSLGSELPWQVWFTQREGHSQKYMSIFMFHGIYDGISVPLLLDALHKLSSGTIEPCNFGPQFHDALCHGPLLNTQGAPDFWRRVIKHVRPLKLPETIEKTSRTTRAASFEIETSKIGEICFSLSVTLQDVFHAVWLLTLAKYFNINPTIGIVLSGRSIDFENADKIIGPMFNTLPFTIDGLSNGSSLADLMVKCHHRKVDVLLHQHTALSSIKKWVKLISKDELFDSLFVYHGYIDDKKNASHHPWVAEQSETVADYPLNIEVERLAKDKYRTNFATSTSLQHDTVATLMASFKSLLNTVHNAQQIMLPSPFFDDEFGDVLCAEQVVVDSTSHEDEVHWEGEAKIIRDQISALADIDEVNIKYSRPTLFELGLDSVDALKLASRLKIRGIQLPVSKILRYPTVAGMIEQWDKTKGGKTTQETTTVKQEQQKWMDYLRDAGVDTSRTEMVMPATPMQAGLLLDFNKYFHVAVFKLDAGTDIGRFDETLDKVQHDLPILRARPIMLDHATDDVVFLQAVMHPCAGNAKPQRSVHLKDLKELDAAISHIKDNACVDNCSPIMNIAHTADGNVYFVLALSHAFYDGWSMQLLLDRIRKCHTSKSPGRTDSHLIAQYIHDMRQILNDPIASEYWTSRLDNVKATLVATSQSSLAPAAAIRQRLSKVPLRTLHEGCKMSGITLQSLGLAAWTSTLVILTRQLDVNFGVVVSGRTSEDSEPLIFPTFNTVICRPNVNREMDKQQFLRHIHQLAVENYAYQHFPLSKALRIAGKESADLFNTLFTFQRSPKLDMPEDTLFKEVELEAADLSPPYPINIEMRQLDENVTWTSATQTGAMHLTSIDDMLDTLDDVLAFLVSQEETSIFKMTDDTLSVCGLPGIELKKEEDQIVRHPDKAKGTEDLRRKEWSDTERIVRNVFAEVSGVDPADVSHHTGLFHIGLDSVSAIRVSKVLRDAGLKIPVSLILRGQTVAKIASAFDESNANGTNESISGNIVSHKSPPNAMMGDLRELIHGAGLLESDVESIEPAIAGQVYMLDLWQASKGSLSYATFFFEIEDCDRINFEKAYKRLVEITPVLRSRYSEWHGQYYQIVLKPGSQHTGPLSYTADCIQDSLLVVLHIHHALYDAVSLDLMVRQLRSLCQDLKRPIKYHSDPALFINMTRSSDSAREFWVEYLDRGHLPPSGNKGFLGNERTQVFVPSLMPVTKLSKIARIKGLSIQALLFAVVARTLARFRTTLGEKPPETTILGIYLSNRSLDLESLQDLVAPTFNVLPLKVVTSPRASILESAKKVQEDLQDISRAENCGVSLREIHTWTGLKLECNVNFLKLPDQHGKESRRPTETTNFNGVVIKHATHEALSRAKDLSQRHNRGLTTTPFVGQTSSGEHVADWCVPALDIEAKIDDDGNLAVGMFAQNELFDKAQLDALMAEVKDLLEKVQSSERNINRPYLVHD